MAIITLWNDNTGKVGQTYSAIALASYMAIEHNYKILLMSTRYNDQVTMQAFGMNDRAKTVGMLTNNKQSMDLESGIEGMAKLVTSNRLSPDMIPNYTKIIYKNRLEVVAAPKKREDVEYDRVYKSCKDILNIAKKQYDIVFVDLNYGMPDETTKEIIKMSDILLLNIEQKPAEIQKILELKENKEMFNPKKLLILINDYNKLSKYSTKNITREIGEKKEILAVPYSNLFSEAIQEGNVAEFFLNARLKRIEGVEDITGFFIRELKRATDAIVYKMQELQMRF